jgi:hypothetical protein
MLEDFRDTSNIVWTDPQPTRSPEDVRVELACFADCWCIDERHAFCNVVHHDAIEERLITVLQGGQTDELLNGFLLGSQSFQLECDLLLDGQVRLGQKAFDLD